MVGPKAWYSVTPNSFSISQLPLKQSLIICGTTGCMSVAEMGLPFFIIFIFNYVFIGCAGSSLLPVGFLVAAAGATLRLLMAVHFSLWSTDSRPLGLSSCTTQALLPVYVEFFWTRDGTWFCVGKQILIHCPTREVLGLTLNLGLKVCLRTVRFHRLL